ncbi:LuxR C-terminal-related transcriptional regulator [Tsukamurella sp. PLM1]|uniref:LuxR C-terminal-related transcriptional regulator n=1 Tax=Tsukamurella sp. PLM1 TaxID=2929795 RepID=UPI00204D4F2C|nr:LuxR C-terminal-related transcriptional regulator [Tsukamurella sp. PLM1]BDH55256.1 hypothetical protein MTP03_01950 [Tsukamurella sp. PLM1]
MTVIDDVRTGGHAPERQRIRMSAREREVLTTYVLGATVTVTAAEHFIGEATVRTHYRRVVERYAAVGRPVGNRVQLLLLMVADGWIDLDDALRRIDQATGAMQ